MAPGDLGENLVVASVVAGVPVIVLGGRVAAGVVMVASQHERDPDRRPHDEATLDLWLYHHWRC